MKYEIHNTLKKYKWYRWLMGGTWYYGGNDWEDPHWTRSQYKENILKREEW